MNGTQLNMGAGPSGGGERIVSKAYLRQKARALALVAVMAMSLGAAGCGKAVDESVPLQDTSSSLAISTYNRYVSQADAYLPYVRYDHILEIIVTVTGSANRVGFFVADWFGTWEQWGTTTAAQITAACDETYSNLPCVDKDLYTYYATDKDSVARGLVLATGTRLGDATVHIRAVLAGGVELQDSLTVSFKGSYPYQ